MILVFGERAYGESGALGSVKVVTRWFHVWGVPLVPVRSYVVFDDQQVAIPLDLRSVGTTAARAWPFWALPFLAALGAWNAWALVAPALAYVVTFLSSVRLASLSQEERARRLVYAEITGHAIDVAHLAAQDLERRKGLQSFVEKRALTLSESGYREGIPSWDELVARGTATDRELLVAAVTYARYERGGAPSMARESWDVIERAAFRRLVTIDPSVLTRARDVAPVLPDALALDLSVPPREVLHEAPAPMPPVTAPAATLSRSDQNRVVGVVMGSLATGVLAFHVTTEPRIGIGIGAMAGAGVALALFGDPRDERGHNPRWFGPAVIGAAVGGVVVATVLGWIVW